MNKLNQVSKIGRSFCCCQVMIWDFQATEGMFCQPIQATAIDVCNKEFSVNYSSRAKSIVGILCVCKAMLDAINDNDFLWRPVVRVQLQRQAGMRVSFMFLHVRHCFML